MQIKGAQHAVQTTISISVNATTDIEALVQCFCVSWGLGGLHCVDAEAFNHFSRASQPSEHTHTRIRLRARKDVLILDCFALSDAPQVLARVRHCITRDRHTARPSVL